MFRINSLLGHVGHISATKWMKMVVCEHDLKKYLCNPIILDVYTYWVGIQNWFADGTSWPNFGPLVATKRMEMVVSHHYLKKYPRNPIYNCGLHLFGECSELVCFVATLAEFGPFNGHKMTENGGFWPLPAKVLLQSNSNFVCTLIRTVFMIHLLFGRVGLIVAH